MSELIGKLGLDWKLLLAQAVNFLLILVILRLTVYKPLVRILNERRRKIEQGLKDAEDAAKGLSEIEIKRKERLGEAEKESLAILAKTEGEAKRREAQIIEETRVKETEILKTAEKVALARKEEAEMKFFEGARGLVKLAVAKTAALSPSSIDESLVDQAIQEVKKLPR